MTKIYNETIIIDGIYLDTGSNVEIGCQSLIGCMPKAPHNSSNKIDNIIQRVTVGNNSYIGHKCIIYAGVEIGDNCYIADGTMIRESVKIGNNTTIGRGCVIEQDVFIGNNVRIREQVYFAPKTIIEDNCFIAAKVSTYNDNTIGRKFIEKKYKAPIIKKDSRIGGNVTLLPGIVIGINSVIGAGSVVTKNIPNGEVWLGNPIRFIRTTIEQNILEETRTK